MSIKYFVVLLLVALFLFIATPHTRVSAPRKRMFGVILAALSSSASNQSLCSERSTARGEGQKVISYSFYGPLMHRRRYILGIEANLKDMVKVYSGWVMRVYYDAKDGDAVWAILHELQKFYPHLDVCSVRNLTVGNIAGRHQRAWRFLPLVDPLVEVMVSRDLDSRFTSRELDAVSEWLRSAFSFHLMRDHPDHTEYILAGMWGARKDLESDFVAKVGATLLKSIIKPESFGTDQNLLRRDLWPAIKGHVMQHDSYFCWYQNYKENGGMTPFPTRRLNISNNFAGCIAVARTNLQTKCPKQCRPRNHTDWIAC